MADYPALPLWTDAYLADTTHLSEEEHGRYTLFLMHLWRAPKCRFPNDDQWLARKFGRDLEWVQTKLRPLITEFCKTDGNWIWQKRLSREFSYVTATSRKQSDRAKSRWQKGKGLSRGNATRGNAPTPTPTPTKETSVAEVPPPKAPPQKPRKSRPVAPIGPAPSARAPVAGHTMDDRSLSAFTAAIRGTIPKGSSPAKLSRTWSRLPPFDPQHLALAWEAYLAECRKQSTNARHPRQIQFPENWLRDRVYEPFVEQVQQQAHEHSKLTAARTETISQWNGHAASVIAAIGEPRFDAWFVGTKLSEPVRGAFSIAVSRDFAARHLEEDRPLLRLVSTALGGTVTIIGPERKRAHG